MKFNCFLQCILISEKYCLKVIIQKFQRNHKGNINRRIRLKIFHRDFANEVGLRSPKSSSAGFTDCTLCASCNCS